jgi:hypothetical protein
MSRRTLELLSDIADHMRSDCEVRKLYALVESALGELVGFRLLTILRMEDVQVRRLHSSDPSSYPAGGVKDISNDTWLREMLKAGKPVVSNTLELVRQRFPDHQAIFSLGCGAVLNVPVTDARQTPFALLRKVVWRLPAGNLVFPLPPFPSVWSRWKNTMGPRSCIARRAPSA